MTATLTTHNSAKRARTARRLDDIEDLIAHGETPPLAIARTGWTTTTAQRLAQRHGRHDLARLIASTEYKETA